MGKQIELMTEPMEVKFQNFDLENPQVYKLFKRFALDFIKRGHKRLGSKMIIERIRYETMIRTTGDKYKINNNYTCHYARKFERENPLFIGYFRTKLLTTY